MSTFKRSMLANAAVVCAVFVAPAAYAQANFNFDLPAQSLAASLKAIGSKTHSNVVFSPSAVRDKTAPALSGSYSAQAALEQLLRGSGLTVTITSGGSFLVREGSSSAVDAGQTVSPGAEETASSLGDENAAASESADIVVTGSRVATGTKAPTPTTVLGGTDLLRIAPQNIANAINQLPVARASQTPKSTTNESTGAGGAGNYLDLRGLGVSRTLVLLDGRRVVNTRAAAGVDLDVIPQAVISGVEIVTGGASAVYGSDAVSGAVNLRIDDKLEGLKATLQGGISRYGDEENYLVSAAWGGSFAENRGHVLIGAETGYNDGVRLGEFYDRKYAARNFGAITNPAYTPTNAEPQTIFVNGAQTSQFAVGGLINGGPLRGIEFGPGGVSSNFQYGTLVTATRMQGGPLAYDPAGIMPEAPSRRLNAFGRVSFDLSDAFTIFAEVNYGRNSSKYLNPTNSVADSVTIQASNAFLPESIRMAMAAAGVTSFSLGRFTNDYQSSVTNLGRTFKRGVGGFKGDLGGGWSLDAYATYGRARQRFAVSGVRIPANYALAVDAVINPATGAVVCRSTLTNPTNGCVPINLFGVGSVSSSAANYVLGDERAITVLTQIASGASVRGEPISTWAGPVTLAVGVEARREKTRVTSDPISSVGGFYFGNVRPWAGRVSVKEAYAEVLVPLLRDAQIAKAFDLNLAGRITDYSTSGTVKTWKVGVTYAVNDSIKLRVARSRDIRAPSPFELFSAGAQSRGFVIDPLTGDTVNVLIATRGNPNLRPEKSDTWTAGGVFTPSFIPGLSLSVDYFDIKVNGAINSTSFDQLVAGCYAARPDFCSLLTRQNGVLVGVFSAPVNLQSLVTRGVDIEANYRLSDVLGGDVLLRALATYTDKLEIISPGGSKEFAGAITQPTIAAIGGMPHWKANASATYMAGPFTGSVTGRYMGGGKFDTTFTSKNQSILSVNGRLLFDISASYDILRQDDNSVQLFGAINNVFDKAPPQPGVGGFVTARALYDAIGQTFTAGVRVRY